MQDSNILFSPYLPPLTPEERAWAQESYVCCYQGLADSCQSPPSHEKSRRTEIDGHIRVWIPIEIADKLCPHVVAHFEQAMP